MRFTYHPKAVSSLKKHGVSFTAAVSVFANLAVMLEDALDRSARVLVGESDKGASLVNPTT